MILLDFNKVRRQFEANLRKSIFKFLYTVLAGVLFEDPYINYFYRLFE